MGTCGLAGDNDGLRVDPAAQGVLAKPLQGALGIAELGGEAVGGREAVVDGGDGDAV